MDEQTQDTIDEQDVNQASDEQGCCQANVQTETVVEEVNVDYKDKWLRAQADYQNLQKETVAQRSQWIKMSEVQILQEFIPVYENFKKAFASAPAEQSKEVENWAKGIGFIMKQFEDILKQHNIVAIETVGKTFDPNFHEALSEEESADHDAGVILREVQGGYMLGDKVLQVAKVVVVKGEG